MTFEEKLKDYAELIARCGVNVQKGETVVIRAEVEHCAFARMIEEAAYKAGADNVVMNWSDSQSARLKFDYAPLSEFEKVPQWQVEYYNGYAKEKACFISITGSDPEIFKGVDPQKQIASGRASHKALETYMKMLSASQFKWTVAAVPTEAWARKVYPELEAGKAVAKLWENIFACVRVGKDRSPEDLWKEHAQLLGEKRDWLTKQQFRKLRYENSLGTDFTVGIVENHRWEGGADTFADTGDQYFANMPTEEVFTMPHRLQAEGTLVSSLPLVYRGNVIKNFRLTFREGAVVDYSAQEGKEVLDSLFAMDEGSKHLGEIALVPYPDPVALQGILFYDTLFDENAACHFALGACYETNLVGGTEMSEEEVDAHGGNHSMNHVDFMVGTADLKVTGIKEDGTEVLVFEHGTWAF